MDLSPIQHVVIVMLENRSFDHMLGYLSLPEYGGVGVEGVAQAQQLGFNNTFGGVSYVPKASTSLTLPADPPHEREYIEDIQIGPSLAMGGFVESYSKASNPPPIDNGSNYPAVMEYLTPGQIFVTDFLARNFAVCDHWFAPLPASTQPNRLIAMSGYALQDHTREGLITNQFDLVYDWLDHHNVSWKVYHESSPFFMLMPRILKLIALGDEGGSFQKFETFLDDAANDNLPQVSFLEPTYNDDIRKTTAASDDHPTCSVMGGQKFLAKIYDAISTSAAWPNTVMIFTYDEHGGFFDHVRPLALRTPAPQNGNYIRGFETSGVRVPGIVISPFVKRGYIHKLPLDHISILKFLGQLYGRGQGYSALVDQRPIVGSVADVLNFDSPTLTAPSRDTSGDAAPVQSGPDNPSESSQAMQKAFGAAHSEMRRSFPTEAAAKFSG